MKLKKSNKVLRGHIFFLIVQYGCESRKINIYNIYIYQSCQPWFLILYTRFFNKESYNKVNLEKILPIDKVSQDNFVKNKCQSLVVVLFSSKPLLSIVDVRHIRVKTLHRRRRNYLQFFTGFFVICYFLIPEDEPTSWMMFLGLSLPIKIKINV
jgi:hypothetical protein